MQPSVAVRGISMRIVETSRTSPIGVASEVAYPNLLRPSTYGANPATLAPPSTSRNRPTYPVKIQPVMRIVLLGTDASERRVSTTGRPRACVRHLHQLTDFRLALPARPMLLVNFHESRRPRD